MKIDMNRYTQDLEATGASQRTTADRRVRSEGNRPSGETRGDRVEVSPDALLMTSALQATNNAPAIRTELVDRLRAKLNAGEVGQDSGALADRLIDDLLNR